MLDRMTVTAIEDVFTVDSPKGRRVDIHNRESYGISFCCGGRITYYQNDCAVVSDRRHMVLLPQGQDYSLVCDSAGLFPVINVLCTAAFRVTAPTAFPLRDAEPYLQDFEQLRELFFLGGRSARCMSILYRMLADIAAEQPGAQNLPDAALHYLEQHYADPALSNASAAAYLHVSEAYFRKLFRDRFGTTPKQYVLGLRIRKARRLLSERRCSIGAVAEDCGFSSVYHFSRAFRQAVGVSPTEYGQTARKDGI